MNSYGYDNNGNVKGKVDARGITTSFVYDSLNRVISRSYSDGTPTVTYTYDAAGVSNSKGRLTSVSSSGSLSNVTAYDVLGRVTSTNQVTDGQTYSMGYSYNRAGAQTSFTYPSGRVISTEYDMAGRMAGVRDQQSGAYYAGAVGSDSTNRIKYAAHGGVSAVKLGNNLWEHTDFNSRLQSTEIGLGTSSTDSGTLRLTYNYGTTSNNGNLLSVSYLGGGLSYTQSFGYDLLNRLTTSTESSGGWSQTNKYDRYGNRAIDFGGGNQSLYFNNANQITNAGYTHDAAGNLTSDGAQSFGYDAENKIKTVNGVSDVYRYDGDGNRVRKNFASGEKVRMVYSGGQLIAEYDLTNGSLKKEYVYGPKGLVATIEPGAGTRYTTADHLGSPRVVTIASAAVVSRHDYMPFGEELSSGVGGRTTGMGFTVTDGIRQKFTSKERDVETGLDYFGARYFASTQGRFVTVDPFAGSGRPAKPQSWNRYAYVSNNPLTLVDPDGMDEQVAQQVVDIGKDKIINKKIEEIRKTAKPLKPGVEPVATSIVYVPGEQTNLENATVVGPDGETLGTRANGYMRPVGVAVLDQGGNIMNAPADMFIKEKITADSPDARAEEKAGRLITSEKDERSQANNGLFYDIQVRGTGPLSRSLDIRTTQDLTVRQYFGPSPNDGKDIFKIQGIKIRVNDLTRTITIIPGRIEKIPRTGEQK
jgi:RHS repeat-associated protein